MKTTNSIDRCSQLYWLSQFRRRAFAVILVLMAVGLTNTAFADDIKDAKKTTSAFFKEQSFTATIDLQTTGEYHVGSDGRPWIGEKQGRSKKRLGIGQRDIAFAAGSGGKGIYVSVSKRKKRIVVTVAPRRGPTMHAAKLSIHFDRPLGAADITPEAIGRALASYVEFTGLDIDGDLNAALEELGSGEPAPTKVSQTTMSNLANVVVTTNPENVVRGGSVSLEIWFEIAGSNSQQVSEARTLSLDGKTLSGFPKEYGQSRSAGSHVSRYQQPIPSSARPGIYSYKGEACVAGDCVSRTVSFTVE